MSKAADYAGAKAPAFNTRYSHPASSGTKFENPSLTMQQFKQEASIDFLIQRYRKTGSFYDVLQMSKARTPMFGDYTDVPDYKTSLDVVNRCSEIFYRLPAVVRAQFGNDISVFCAFVGNPANLQKSIDLGVFPELKTKGVLGDSSPNTADSVTQSGSEPKKGNETSEQK